MQPTNSVIGFIPARLNSTRLPRKPLLPIAGRAMIERVYEGARPCRRLSELWIATDSEEIAEYCRARQMPVKLTSTRPRSGSDRILEALAGMPAEAVVNIQGDEPMVRPEMIDCLLDALFARPEMEVATLRTRMGEAASGSAPAATEAASPAAVKVVCDRRGQALYFSRSTIPFPRGGAATWWKHLGYYAYSRAALERFAELPAGELEIAEQLEQLRFLENGIGIAVGDSPCDTVGVDTRADLERAERYFRQQQ